MLTDIILEEEFDKDGERWCNSHDLEQDLHLAAELGKTLLDQNHELEEALQQMYSTNQEQLQEIEYLTKQVNLLREMNDHHSKVYEQLDIAAQDLEQGNQRLVQDNRLAQQKIQSLTETIDNLQSHMENLQTQVDELKASQADRNRRDSEQRRALGAQSMSCLKELYDLQHNRHFQNDTEGLWSQKIFRLNQNSCLNAEEEQRELQRCVQTLRTQIGIERSYREAAEREIELTTKENKNLEDRLALLDGCRVRKQELEAEVEQLRCQWQKDCATKRSRQLLFPHAVFFPSNEQPEGGQSEIPEKLSDEHKQLRQRCNSDSVLRVTDELRLRHDPMCVRRAESVKQSGVSLWHEVDAQYSTLQVKYEELLLRCKEASNRLTHKAVQTSTSPFVLGRSRRRLSDLSVVCEEGQPEYKVLFRELFSCIQKSKEDLHCNRVNY